MNCPCKYCITQAVCRNSSINYDCELKLFYIFGNLNMKVKSEDRKKVIIKLIMARKYISTSQEKYNFIIHNHDVLKHYNLVEFTKKHFKQKMEGKIND